MRFAAAQVTPPLMSVRLLGRPSASAPASALVECDCVSVPVIQALSASGSSMAALANSDPREK